MESKLGFHHLDTDLNTERYLVQDPIRDLNSGHSFDGGFEALARTESKLGFYHLGTDLNTDRHLVQDPIRDLNLGSPGLVSAARRGWREHLDVSKNEEMAMAVITIARSFSSLLPSLGK
jgi:hypothetical protein